MSTKMYANTNTPNHTCFPNYFRYYLYININFNIQSIINYYNHFLINNFLQHNDINHYFLLLSII